MDLPGQAHGNIKVAGTKRCSRQDEEKGIDRGELSLAMGLKLGEKVLPWTDPISRFDIPASAKVTEKLRAATALLSTSPLLGSHTRRAPRVLFVNDNDT
jgi:hypothetical protein